MCGLCSFRVLFYPVILLYIIVPSMSTLLNKFLLLVSYNIITYELYILLYRLFGISSEGWRGSALAGIRSAGEDRSGRSVCRGFCIVCGSASVAVSASAPGIGGGFRDNAGRGVRWQKLERFPGCFLPLSGVPVA